MPFKSRYFLSLEISCANVRAKVRGNNQEYYEVTASIDEEFGDVTNCNCGCEAFYNYEGMCKHCVAALLQYLNHRTAVEILRLKERKKEKTGEEDRKSVASMETEPPLKNLLGQYSMRATSKYMLPEMILGKVELEPYFEMDYGYASLCQELMYEYEIKTGEVAPSEEYFRYKIKNAKNNGIINNSNFPHRLVC